jgi:hypothetical protein
LNIIADQLGNVLYDNERANGSTYYYHPADHTCNVIDMGVGLLKPDWLVGATYLGEVAVNTIKCDMWEQGSAPDDGGVPFVTYYNKVGADTPIRWVFYDGASFDVMRWAVNETANSTTWEIPPYCFSPAF